MATIQSTLKLQDNMSKTLSKVNKGLIATGNSMDTAAKKTNNLKDKLKQTSDTAPGLNRLNGIIGTLISSYTALKIAQTADTLASNEARLGLIAREGEEVDALSDKIYAAAQRSRTSYTDMAASVSKLGLTAGDKFTSTDEIIRFNELLNKSFVVGGAGATEQAAAMYQLTQAMGSGRLQGDEYRSIIENAPLLAKSIEAYMRNVEGAKGSMKDWAADGKLTAEVIKAALFNSAEETEARYKEMPMTFAQAWTSFKNSATKAFEPLFKMLSGILQAITPIFEFLAENQYIFYVIAGAALALAAVWLVLNASTIAATVSQWAMNSAMLACPITWIVLLIAALIGVLIYLWNTNDDVAYAFIWAWDMVQIGLQTFGLGFKALWFGLLNVIGQFKVTALLTIEGFVNGAIGLINNFINMLNMIPGVSINTITWSATFGTEAAAAFAEEKATRDAELAKDAQEIVKKKLEMDASREERVQNRAKIGTGEGGIFGDNSLIGTDGAGGKALKTTSNDNLLSDDDIKLLLDVATRDYKLNYQQITPNITMTFGDIRETANVDDVMDALADRIEEVYDANLEVVQ